VVERADAILFATRTNRDEYASHYGPDLARKFHVVANGCDPDDFVKTGARPVDDQFVMVHAGSLYGQRSPVPVFRAIASSIDKGVIRREGFRLRLIGDVGADNNLAKTAAALRIDDVVELVPRMPRREICQQMMAASALLLLQPGTTVSIPGKLYEYFAASRPILSLSEDGELSDLVTRSGIGVVVSPRDDAAIESGLMRVIELAAGPVAAPAADLFDGNRTAADAAAIIAGLARRRTAGARQCDGAAVIQ
jgi:glycosyltransferase involved in cell wall biosynthesis